MSAVRILHVDDEPDIREIVEMALGLNAEFEVRAAPAGPMRSRSRPTGRRT
jgi:DNA-binding NtrC family response regulator